MKKVADRLTTCEQWEWKRGMVAISPLTSTRMLITGPRDAPGIGTGGLQTGTDILPEGSYPDLDDVGVQGHLANFILEADYDITIQRQSSSPDLYDVTIFEKSERLNWRWRVRRNALGKALAEVVLWMWGEA